MSKQTPQFGNLISDKKNRWSDEGQDSQKLKAQLQLGCDQVWLTALNIASCQWMVHIACIIQLSYYVAVSSNQHNTLPIELAYCIHDHLLQAFTFLHAIQCRKDVEVNQKTYNCDSYVNYSERAIHMYHLQYIKWCHRTGRYGHM